MKLKNPMLVVRDIDQSVEFYNRVFGLHVIMDFGANKTLTGGLALQTAETYQEFIGDRAISFGGNNFELYFEEDDFDLTKAADIISQDTALIISLLRLANTRSFNSEITSVRVAVSMLGQKDLTRWIQTTVIEKLCSDKPNEPMRLSLLRAKFAENLAPVFGMAMRSQELFLTGLFSILDIILDCSMEEALSMVRVSGKIRAALLERTGSLAEVLHFIVKYESAEWQEVSRQLVLKNIEIPDVSHAWVSSLQWYAKLIAMNE